jgi:K+-transporting ATPase A subunit
MDSGGNAADSRNNPELLTQLVSHVAMSILPSARIPGSLAA